MMTRLADVLACDLLTDALIDLVEVGEPQPITFLHEAERIGLSYEVDVLAPFEIVANLRALPGTGQVGA